MRRFAVSARERAEGKFEIVWYIDNDDKPSLLVADELFENGLPSQIVVGPRLVLSQTWNACATVARGEILGHMGDDITFGSPPWVTHIEEAFEGYPDRIVFVHGRDGVHDERLGTHGFLHRKWVDAVGYFVPPYFAHDWNDAWLTEVADLIGRRCFVPLLLTEHHHPDVGKAPMDDTYREHTEAGKQANVGRLYGQLELERRADAEKLRAAMTGV